MVLAVRKLSVGVLPDSILQNVDAMKTEPEELEGLKWVVERWALSPRWTIDLDVEHIREVVGSVLSSPQELSITFLAKGAFNKVYNIRTEDEELIMRVTLPVDPQWKTLSEVATLEWVRRNTHLPVPEVFAHEASRDNPIGFEWILMSKLPGRPLLDVWTSMDFAAKKQLTHEVVLFLSSLFKKQLRGIGNLYSDRELEAADDRDLPEVRRIVSMHFFWGHRVTQLVPRGPFRSSRDWLEACLLCVEQDCKSTIARCNAKLYPVEDDDDNNDDDDDEDEDEDDDDDDEDEDEEEDADEEEMVNNVVRANDVIGVVSRLKLLLDDLFPYSKDKQAEASVLFHDDLAQRNILVDDAGVLTGVVDWECVSALPLWKACDYPEFLQGPDLHEEPLLADYGGELVDYFHDEMVNYETTRLRKYFLEEMQEQAPGWVQVFKASEQQRDFEAAVRHCGDPGTPYQIHSWLDNIALGKEKMHRLWHRHLHYINPVEANAVEVC